MIAVGVWHFRTAVGTFVLRRLLSGAYALFIDDLALGTYPTGAARTLHAEGETTEHVVMILALSEPGPFKEFLEQLPPEQLE